MDDTSALALIDKAFGGAPRPEHFTDFSHCEECAEHDATLLMHTRESLPRSALGYPGWNPVSFVTSEGYRYYLPAIARIAMNRKDGSEYLDQFSDDLREELFSSFSDEQRSALASFLEYLRVSRDSDIRSFLRPNEILEQLEAAVSSLRDPHKAGSSE